MAFLDETGLGVLWECINDHALADETKALYGLPESASSDDVFLVINRKIDLITANLAEISVTVLTPNGSPVGGIEVTGVYDENGNTVLTNDSGVASGYVSEGEQTISVVGYGDLTEVSESFTVMRGDTITKTLTTTRRNFVKIITSQNLRFTENVTRVDVTVVGGGGGGSGARNSKDSATYSLGGGGGGGYCTVQENVPFEPDIVYSAIVGSGGGGSAGSISSSASNSGYGGTGGTSSFLGVSANGGGGGTPAGSGYGPGTVGVGNNTGTAGYSSFTETVLYGGCGANGCVTTTSNIPSGAAYGASSGSDAQDGFGGGGGGGCTRANANIPGAGGDGGDGCVAIRMHLVTT